LENNTEMNLKFGGRMWIVRIAHDCDSWQSFANTVMNLSVLQQVGNFVDEQLLGSQRRPSWI
jgi:hypothetical protein